MKSIRAQNGNAFFLILVAISLFVALNYAITQSGRSGDGGINSEREKLDQSVYDNYVSNVNLAVSRLTMTECSAVDYTPPADINPAVDHSCHVFHPDGGGAYWMDYSTNACPDGSPISDLAAGEGCGNFVYIEEFGGNRIYTTPADSLASTPWSDSVTVTNVTNDSDGLANTIALADLSDATYGAAAACIALGDNWYLPSKDELQFLYENMNEGVLAGSFPSSRYWGSTEKSSDSNQATRLNIGNGNISHQDKVNNYAVRCFYRE